MDYLTVFLDGARIVFGFLLVLFIPGFAISLVYFPNPNDLRLPDRLIYSMVLSIGSVLILVLFMEFVLGVNTTPRNVFLFICAFSILAFGLWYGERRYQITAVKIPVNVPSLDYHEYLRRGSRLVNSFRDSFRKTSSTGVIYHENLSSGPNHVDHSILIDIGEEIDIQQIIEYNRKVCDCVLLTPPHPRTRYFEIFIHEYADDDLSKIEELQVYPVLAVQEMTGGRLSRVLSEGLKWKITQRIYKQAGTTKIQWIYHHDFHISAIAKPGDTIDLTVDRVIGKIDEIAASIKRGSRITSHIEDHLMRRKTFVTEMEKFGGAPGTRIEIGQPAEFQFLDELEAGDCRKLQYDVLQDLVDLGVTLDTIGGDQQFRKKFKLKESTDKGEPGEQPASGRSAEE